MKARLLCCGDEGGGVLFVEAAEPYLFGWLGVERELAEEDVAVDVRKDKVEGLDNLTIYNLTIFNLVFQPRLVPDTSG